MDSRLPEIDDDGEVGDLSEVDSSLFKPAADVLPTHLLKLMGIKPRGKQKAQIKQAVTVRFSQDVLEAFRSTGAGWQPRMNEALRDWLRTHSPV